MTEGEADWASDVPAPEWVNVPHNRQANIGTITHFQRIAIRLKTQVFSLVGVLLIGRTI